MDNQKKYATKSNRASAPFYSPPLRHYGQTPSEIIREARATVMSSATAGIKPVFTNRPFTPKENERTLFGNVKKRLSRPPSSFSLSYLQKPDSLPRIKLPAITTLRKKSARNSNFRTVHSLENLIEECESETPDSKKSYNCKNLPVFRNSHSSPQERNMVRATSFTDKITWKTPDKENIFKISQAYVNDDFGFSHNMKYLEPTENAENYLRDMNVSRQSKVSENDADSQFTIYQLKDGKIPNRKISDGAHDLIVTAEFKDNVGIEKHEEKESKAEVDEFPENFIEDMMNYTYKKCYEFPVTEKNTFENIVTLSDSSINLTSDCKTESFTEKSIGTEVVSDYLTFVSDGVTADKIKNQFFENKEILELHETAEFYEYLSNTSREGDSNLISNKAEKFEKNVGNAKPYSKFDYLKAMKQNIENFDLKMKQLNESIETFEEKLNGRNRIYSTKNLDNGDKTDSSGSSTYKMNENRRYHMSSRESVAKEREYRNEKNDFSNSGKKHEGFGLDGFWKSSYYKQNDESENNAFKEDFGTKKIEDVLIRLNKIDKNYDANKADIISVMDALHKILKNGDYISKQAIDNDMKIKILRNLYCFADCEDPEMLLNLSRIVFALKVESSLLDACKMVFKVARLEVNDHLFLELDSFLELFLDGVGLASPLESPECCIYGYGALKFLTMNYRILSKLIHLGVLDLLILHLKMINSVKLEGEIIKEQTQYALFQIIGAIRNIAAGDGVLPLFINTNSIPVLSKVLVNFGECEDIITNTSRVLSILSADEDATEVLMTTDNVLEIIMALIERYQSNDKILIRLAYCLGNIVAYSDLARIQLSRSEGSVTVLLKILQVYLEKNIDILAKENSKTKNEMLNNDVADDVIVKIVRILANMCMNPVVGSNLSPCESNGKNSLKLLEILSIILHRKEPGIVLLACLGCLNNISYYSNNYSSLIDITKGVVRVLTLPDEECQAEAAKVLGNLTRHKEIRNLIYETGGIERLTKLLDSKDKDLYKSSCGALVNLLLDPEIRTVFKETQGINKLVSGLEKFTGDWAFAGLICRAIWNSCADDIGIVMETNNVEALLNTLASSLDEENGKDGDASWEEFAFLATDLLEKINAYLETRIN